MVAVADVVVAVAGVVVAGALAAKLYSAGLEQEAALIGWQLSCHICCALSHSAMRSPHSAVLSPSVPRLTAFK